MRPTHPKSRPVRRVRKKGKKGRGVSVKGLWLMDIDRLCQKGFCRTRLLGGIHRRLPWRGGVERGCCSHVGWRSLRLPTAEGPPWSWWTGCGSSPDRCEVHCSPSLVAFRFRDPCASANTSKRHSNAGNDEWDERRFGVLGGNVRLPVTHLPWSIVQKAGPKGWQFSKAGSCSDRNTWRIVLTPKSSFEPTATAATPTARPLHVQALQIFRGRRFSSRTGEGGACVWWMGGGHRF